MPASANQPRARGQGGARGPQRLYTKYAQPANQSNLDAMPPANLTACPMPAVMQQRARTIFYCRGPMPPTTLHTGHMLQPLCVSSVWWLFDARHALLPAAPQTQKQKPILQPRTPFDCWPLHGRRSMSPCAPSDCAAWLPNQARQGRRRRAHAPGPAHRLVLAASGPPPPPLDAPLPRARRGQRGGPLTVHSFEMGDHRHPAGVTSWTRRRVPPRGGAHGRSRLTHLARDVGLPPAVRVAQLERRPRRRAAPPSRRGSRRLGAAGRRAAPPGGRQLDGLASRRRRVERASDEADALLLGGEHLRRVPRPLEGLVVASTSTIPKPKRAAARAPLALLVLLGGGGPSPSPSPPPPAAAAASAAAAIAAASASCSSAPSPGSAPCRLVLRPDACEVVRRHLAPLLALVLHAYSSRSRRRR